MKTRIFLIAMFCAGGPQLRAQNATVEQFLHDRSLQDSIIAAIVPNHILMSKLINKISENRQLHEMVIQHLTRLLNQKSSGAGEHDHASHETMSHYVGDETREIKALSETDVKALVNGEGIGLAMAAELNHYPGPRHVLDLGDKLELSNAQKKSIQESFDRMHAQAVELGKQLVEEERVLDKAFASKTVTRSSLEQQTKNIEELRGRLRYVHLAAHIDVRNILTPQQIEAYDLLRGYSKP